MSNETQHTPADVRGRIIRASILPIEDEETMIAGLRAGAEAVERGELDAEDFAGIWSQYLRELFRRASSVPAPADVRERVAKEVYLWEATRVGADESWALRSWEQESNTRRRLYFNVADCILALLRTPRGEGERVKEPTQAQIDDACMWYRHDFGLLSEKERDSVRFEARQWFRAWGKALSNGDDPAALRSEVQGEDRWEDLVFGPITEAYNEAHAAHRGEAPGDGPVGAVCANCGAPNAAIAGGELDPDEAVCSVECYEQLRELGCPQEHGGDYRPKPALRSEAQGEEV